MITKYTFLDEQWHETKEGKPQRHNPRSITRGAPYTSGGRFMKHAYVTCHTYA